ncbi:beta-3-deoxy-D-manno-oct-2-ulosonic acid transferase [Roseomonas xinghualingensis]|uniref:capsular polysaccharide export protein, LipB/KpsS family n=1 Tax=Roseomonas xinghualingensis TaxID=2986475 RepID=UPI0021F15BD5|nr:beta-3-deoxy-D-manno-oct-2-ulosonic acid transferase [Roseomonas sp. SXEYE001]MCV4207784.1 beta-3-deoxy-D-manno-oct-2-ulosonic acid transferase [Roseomonas sp. SXEYE001]
MTSPEPTAALPPLSFPSALLVRWPHLPAFWPGRAVAPAGPGAVLVLEEGSLVPADWAGPVLRFSLGPFAPPSFAGRSAPPLILLDETSDLPAGEAKALAALVAQSRLGGPLGLPDPGAAMLALPARAVALVLDPCDPAQRATAEAALTVARAGVHPVLVARDPWADPAAAPVLPPLPGLRRLPQPLSPWTLLDAAATLHGASPVMAALAEAAGVPHDRTGEHLQPLLARTRAADPFRRRPWTRADSLALLADWTGAERSNRGVAAAIGIARWKRRQVGALLAREGGTPFFTHDAARAVERARAEGGAIVAWAASCPDTLAATIRGQGVELRLLEDGFVRSRGLGARFLPGASYCLDPLGAHYDPRQLSTLESMLAQGGFTSPLLARAVALRAEIVRRGVSKYNLTGEAALPAFPRGRRVVLVPGQVEDDASVRLGGGAIRSNLDLLRAVRAAEPDAFILYKPHPDLEAGFRRGRLRAAELKGLADAVVGRVPLPALLPQVDALHTLTSLSGFEALLRGVAVTCWGQPFYAGWGLTEDRAPFPAGRRGIARTLDELVAAALILYPRYVDPVTLLPCPPEVMLDRLEDPTAWRLSPFTLHRGLEGFLRGTLARIGGRR